MTAPGVLLDLDGTLVDTNHLHALAWWRAFRRLGKTFPIQRVHNLVGMGGDKLVAELLGHEDSEASGLWSEEFHELFDEVTLLPGARELVERLYRSGLVMVLASSAPADDLARFRDILEIDGWIAGATSSDDADRSKPDPDIFTVAMDRYGLSPATTIAIGDTIWDARAARAANVGFVAVTSGGTDADVLRREGAAEVRDDVGQLALNLDSGPLARLIALATEERGS